MAKMVAFAVIAACACSDHKPPPDPTTPPAGVAPVAADPPAAIDAAVSTTTTRGASDAAVATNPAPQVASASAGRPTALVAEDGIVVGGLDKATVIATVKARTAAFTECYAHALVDDPEIAGLARFMFVIARDGSVKEAEIGRIDVRLEPCVRRTLEATKFPASAKATTEVTLPVYFKRVP
jgi:hypothetical protein